MADNRDGVVEFSEDSVNTANRGLDQEIDNYTADIKKVEELSASIGDALAGGFKELFQNAYDGTQKQKLDSTKSFSENFSDELKFHKIKGVAVAQDAADETQKINKA